MKLDVSSDFETVCNDFNVSAVLRVGETDITLPSVLTEPYTIRELEPSGAQVLRQGTLFVWSKKRSSGPPLGSIIIDSEGTYWTIYRLTNKQHVETWEAFALNLSIITAPENTATILVASYKHGRAGEARAIWRGLFSGKKMPTAEDTIPAHFQPALELAKIEFGAEWSEETYKIYFHQPVPMEAAGGEYRILDSQGQRFRVMRYWNENQIAKLPIALAVKIVEGSEFHPGLGDGP